MYIPVVCILEHRAPLKKQSILPAATKEHFSGSFFSFHENVHQNIIFTWRACSSTAGNRMNVFIRKCLVYEDETTFEPEM